MRKPLLAVGLAVSLGSIPLADALAAPPASSKGTTQSSSLPARTTSSVAPNAVSGAEIVQTAMKYLGYPYSATGNSPSTGFSCIGFVSFVYRSLGINLPGDLGGALAFAPRVPFSSLMPGDILFFQNTLWTGLSHAAMYIGGGRFIHAEYYGYGVTISSFNNDRRDGNYWISKFLGANRPWGGAAVPSVLGPTAPTPGASAGGTPGVTTGPGASVVTTISNGPTALVTVPSLYVRSGPSQHTVIQQTLPNGSAVVILGKQNGWYQGKRQVWYKVQLPDGSIGWVVGFGIGMNGSYSGQSGASSGSTVGSNAGAANGIVGNPTAPTRIASTRTPVSRASVSVRVPTLNVRSSPGMTAPVVGSVSQGQHLQVIGRQNGWVKVLLPNGTVGWIYGSYTSAQHQAGAPQTSSTVQKASQRTSQVAVQPQRLSGGSRATVGMNVRSGPSLNSAVVTVVAPGQTYQILRWSNGWAYVRTSSGTAGWISGTVLGTGASVSANRSSSSQRSPSTSRARSSTSGAMLTAGVRVHSAPGVNAPVVGSAASGTHVTVLGYSRGWALVRLPSGQTGYVLGTYVRG